jgi:hypothetical protein
MKVKTENLERLLKTTKRNQFVNGKEQAQVLSCILRSESDRLSTTSVVRDGKTSVARFSISGDGFPGTVPVPDIDRLLGALKFHGTTVALDVGDDKLVVRSNNKQTTMSANTEGRAFPNTQTSIGEWETMSRGRAEVIKDGTYTLRDGDKRRAAFSISLDVEELFDALRCDNMNGQRLNRYAFSIKGGIFSVVVGDHLKGQTKVILKEDLDLPDWESTFEGGLEYVLKHYNGTCAIQIFDFTEEGQGHRMYLDLGGSDFVFQASIL